MKIKLGPFRLITGSYFLAQIGRFAISVERNWPLYQTRWGLRVLRPFLRHGVGIHLGPALIHLHTNRRPAGGQI